MKKLPFKLYLDFNPLRRTKWALITIAIVFFVNQTSAQCNPFERSTNESSPCNIDYDVLVSAYLQSVMRLVDGKIMVWGKSVDNSGNAQLVQPQTLDSLNYPSLRGIVLRYSIGSDQGAVQLIVLTTTGLFVSGQNGTVINNSLTASKTFQKLTVNGKSDGLPIGVNPKDVKMLFATGGAIAITTFAGNVYTLLSQNLSWNQVEISNGVPLTNVCVCRGASRNPDVNFIALRSDNTLWTWGTNTYLGNNSNASLRNFATQMTLPNNVDTVKMIAMTNALSYYLLNTKGRMYSLGLNDQRQLGDFTTQERKAWIVPKKPSGDSFNDVIWISPNEHDRNFASINVLTKNGRLFSWGNDNSSMIGRDKSSATNPLTPPSIDSNTKVSFVETGGNFSILWKKDSLHHCFVGQKKDGSMGDGTTSTQNVENYDCLRPPTIAICPTKPNAGLDRTICGGGKTNFIGNNPSIGVWRERPGNPLGCVFQNMNFAEASVQFADSASGDFYFIYTEILSDTMKITVTPKPKAGLDQFNICGGTSAQLKSLSTTTGIWSSYILNQAGSTLGNTSNGIANVVFKDSVNGLFRFIYTVNTCSDTMSISVVNKPVGISSQLKFCVGSAIDIVGSFPSTGQWKSLTGNALGIKLDTTVNGIAKVTAWDTSYSFFGFEYAANGCSDTIFLKTIAKPNAGIDLTGVCGGNSIQLKAISDSVGVWSSSISNPSGYLLGNTSNGKANLAFNDSINGLYTFIYTENTCSDTMSISVRNKPVGISSQSKFCVGTAIDIVGSFPSTGRWKSLTDNALGIKLDTTVNGIAKVTAWDTSSSFFGFEYAANGCSDTIFLKTIAKPNAGIDLTGVCGGSGIQLKAISDTIGIWSSEISNKNGYQLGFSSNGKANLAFNDSTNGLFTFIYTANTCSDTMKVQVINRPVGMSSQTQICTGSEALLMGTFPSTGLWKILGMNNGDWILDTTINGSAKVRAVDTAFVFFNFAYLANGCADTIVLSILPKPNAGKDQTGICGGGMVQLEGIVKSSSLWTPSIANPLGASLSSTANGKAKVFFSDSSSGMYQFILNDNSCLDTISLTVQNKPRAGADFSTLNNKTIALKGDFPSTGSWTLSDSAYKGIVLDSTFSGQAYVHLSDSAIGNYAFIYVASGCSDTINVLVSKLPPNNKPIAKDDTILVKKGEIYAVNVLKNDFDIDLDSCIVTILEKSKVGSSSLSENLILYFLNSDYNGVDSLTYQISDGKGGFDTANVYFIKKAYQVQANDDYVVVKDSVAYGNVLLNDNFPIEFKKFVRIILKQASKLSGEFELNQDGSYVYSAYKVEDKYDYVLYQLCVITETNDTICDYAWIYLENAGLPIVSDLISPNGDGNNDDLIIKDIERLNNGGMRIYNRMGDLVWVRKVYDNNDPFKGIGMDNENLPTGTYYYVLKYTVVENATTQERYMTGFIELQK